MPRLFFCSNLLLVCIVVGLIFCPRQIHAEKQGIVIDGADYNSTTTTTYPSGLVNISGNVTPRIVMEYADFAGRFSLNKPDDLSNVTSEALPRITLEYADYIFSINPQKPSLDVLIPPRITVEYADFICDTNLVFPEDLITLITPPQIDQPLQDPPQNKVMPNQNATITVNVTDPEHGVKNATLEYNTNNATTWQTKTMIFNSTSNLYYATIPGQSEGTLVKHRIVAYDNAENMAVEDNNGQYYAYTVHTLMPVNLFDPSDPTQNSLKLSWTQAPEDIFVRYEIYISASPYELGTIFQEITNSSQTTCNVTGLIASTTYHFVVRVVYIQDFFADSNKVTGTTLPTPVILYTPTERTNSSLLLHWTQNNDTNFKEYALYRSSAAGNIGTQIVAITTRTSTNWNTTNLLSSTTYYFVLRVLNIQNLTSDSNQVEGTTLPTSVVLYEPSTHTSSSLLLSWAPNTDSSFLRYEIYLSSTAGDLGSINATVTDQTKTSYNVTQLSPSTVYYFTIRVANSKNLFSDSNQVGGETLPTPVILDSPTTKTTSSILLTWTRNNDPNFGKYEVYMSETFSSLGSIVANIGNQATTTYNVTGLLPSETLYFVIRVVNQHGLFSDSNKVEAATLGQQHPTDLTIIPWFPWILVIIVSTIGALALVMYLRRQRRKTRIPPPAKPRPTHRDVTQYYHVSPSAKASSFRLPSGEIRCGNCGDIAI